MRNMHGMHDLIHAACELGLEIPSYAAGQPTLVESRAHMILSGAAPAELRAEAATSRDPKLAGAWLARLAATDPEAYTAALDDASGAILAAAGAHINDDLQRGQLLRAVHKLPKATTALRALGNLDQPGPRYIDALLDALVHHQVGAHDNLAGVVIWDPHTHSRLADVAGLSDFVWTELHRSPFVSAAQSDNAPLKRGGRPTPASGRALAAQVAQGDPDALDAAARSGDHHLWTWAAGDIRADAHTCAANSHTPTGRIDDDLFARRVRVAACRRHAYGDPDGAAVIAALAPPNSPTNDADYYKQAAAWVWDAHRRDPNLRVHDDWWPLLAGQHGAAAALAAPARNLQQILRHLDGRGRAELAEHLAATFQQPERYRLVHELYGTFNGSLASLIATAATIDA